MQKAEFEKLAGYEVSVEDYDKIIEPMYMATELSKEDFVKCVDKKRFALPTKQEILKEMKSIARHLAETCIHYTDYEARNRLEELGREYARRFYGSKDYAFHDEYTFPGMRGCSYPQKIIIFRNKHPFEQIAEIELVKLLNA